MTKNKLPQKVLNQMKHAEINTLKMLENKKNKLVDEMAKAQSYAIQEALKKGDNHPSVLKLNDIAFKCEYFAFKASDKFVAFCEKMRNKYI